MRAKADLKLLQKARGRKGEGAIAREVNKTEDDSRGGAANRGVTRGRQ